MCVFTLVHTEKDIYKIDTKMLTLAVEKGIVKILINFIASVFCGSFLLTFIFGMGGRERRG